jgi:hypothetical protein
MGSEDASHELHPKPKKYFTAEQELQVFEASIPRNPD